VNIARDFEGEHGAEIKRQVRDLLNSLPAFLPEPVATEPAHMPFRTAERFLRNFLASTHGEAWRSCDVNEFLTPGGERAFTASVQCPSCGGIETFLAYLDENNSLVFALPIEGY
jgi:hypothetical protein